MFEIKGVTKVDYIHFLCVKCGSTVTAELGTDGAVPTIKATCAKCNETDTFKLYKTIP